MAYGLPSVTTSIGAEGMGLVDGAMRLLQIVQRNSQHGLYSFTETRRCGVPFRRRLEYMLRGTGVQKLFTASCRTYWPNTVLHHVSSATQ